MRTWLALLLLGAVPPTSSRPGLRITLAHGSEVERAGQAQLERLLREHDVERWILTRDIVIDADAIPHSHPVLTLHCKHLRQDDELIATFVHEQMHWFVDARRPDLDLAVAALRTRYPSLPVGFPEGGFNERSSYEHLVVNHLEMSALRTLVGEARTAAVFAFWKGDHYRALYAIAERDAAALRAVVTTHRLLPPGL